MRSSPRARAARSPDGSSLLALCVHPSAELYGSDRVFLESVIALRERGHRVVVSLPGNGPLVAELRASGAEVITTPTLVLRKKYLSLLRVPALLAHAVRGAFCGIRLLRSLRPDLVYVSTITLPLWPPLARAFRIPVITHVHEAESLGSPTVRALLYLPQLAANALVFNSEFALGVARSAYRRLAGRGVVLYNGVVGPAAPPAPRTDVAGGLNIVYVGRLSPRKGPDVALEAVRRLQGTGVVAQLSLVGDAFAGYEWFEARLRAGIADSALGDRVRLLGFHADIWPFLAEADVLLVPSRFDEPFGNTAVESVLAARPVIASDTSGLREATAGFASASRVPPGDPAALAAALESTMHNWATLREQAVADAAGARARFSPEKYRSGLLQVVTRVTAAPRSRRCVSAR